jgi:hypothetical protein
MLDPWIIEEIKRRERRKQDQEAVIELPIRGPEGRDRSKNDGHEMPSEIPTEKGPPRGVTIIDYGVACW